MVTMNKKTEIKQSNGKHMIQGPGPGRPKGSKNTVNKQVLQDVFTTYQELGGVEYLKEVSLHRFAGMSLGYGVSA
jgi:anthranilate/para-aminobenzoate synthase component II